MVVRPATTAQGHGAVDPHEGLGGPGCTELRPAYERVGQCTGATARAVVLLHECGLRHGVIDVCASGSLTGYMFKRRRVVASNDADRDGKCGRRVFACSPVAGEIAKSPPNAATNGVCVDVFLTVAGDARSATRQPGEASSGHPSEPAPRPA